MRRHWANATRGHRRDARPVLAVEGGILLLLAMAYAVTGRVLGSIVLISLGSLALVCAWALWPSRY
jgi:hypothetical protein